MKLHQHHPYHPSPHPHLVVMRWPRNSSFAILAAVTLVILYFLATTTTSSSTKTTTTTTTQPSLVMEQQVHTVDGYGNSITTTYYPCEPTAPTTASANNNNNKSPNQQQKQQQRQQLVLLHGSRFTKEDWKTSGILQQLCHQTMSVTALDLSVKASYADLVQVLNQLATALETFTLPVQGIVTPSASGKAIIDGLLLFNNNNNNNNQITPSLTDLTERWIPVACLGLLQVKQQQTQLWSNLVLPPSWPILAIYGDQDEPGKQSSELLLSLSSSRQQNNKIGKNQQQVVAVTVKEIPGRHPCYLDSPEAFVQAVTAFLKV